MAKRTERAHALLSASGAARWINCPPSVRLEDEIPETESIYAAEGTLAHALCELKLSADALKTGVYTRRMNKIKKHEQYQEEMQGYTDEYVDYVETIKNGFPQKPYVAIEKKVDYSNYAPDGFGTADCILIHADELHIFDFKYGKGVLVSAEGNPQLGLYALGALQIYGFLFPIKRVTFHIVQPRLHNISSWETTRKELEDWGEIVVKPKAKLAYAGEGEFSSGEHCKFCKVANCRRRAYDNLELLETYEEKLPPNLSDEEVGQALLQAEHLTSWHKKLKAYAQDALLKGHPIPGWKIIEGCSNRTFKDYDKLVDQLEAAGYDRSLFYQTAGVTLTEMEKVVGAKDLAKIAGNLIVKPEGKPTMAKETDKRPVFTPKSTAAEDFK